MSSLLLSRLGEPSGDSAFLLLDLLGEGEREGEREGDRDLLMDRLIDLPLLIDLLLDLTLYEGGRRGYYPFFTNSCHSASLTTMLSQETWFKSEECNVTCLVLNSTLA